MSTDTIYCCCEETICLRKVALEDATCPRLQLLFVLQKLFLQMLVLSDDKVQYSSDPFFLRYIPQKSRPFVKTLIYASKLGDWYFVFTTDVCEYCVSSGETGTFLAL